MARVDVVLNEETEKWLRDLCKKKGDMSRIINEALEYFREYGTY